MTPPNFAAVPARVEPLATVKLAVPIVALSIVSVYAPDIATTAFPNFAVVDSFDVRV